MSISNAVATLRPLKISDAVARDIVHDIVSAGLVEGDSLPSEGVMLEQYGVSRSSLREALRILEVHGLISLRRGPGGGPVVGCVDSVHLGRMTTLYYHLAGATYAELSAAWVDAEAYLADAAARNPDRELVRAAMAPFRRLEHSDELPLIDFVAEHAEFHAVLGRLANNKVMELSLMAIGKIVIHHVVVNLDPRAVAKVIECDHEEIAAAVAAGQPVKARDLMTRHIKALVAFYESELGEQMDQFIAWR